MKRTLSVPSLTFLFLSRMLGGSVGVGVALTVLAQLQGSVGIRRELVATVMIITVLIVATLIVKDWRTWRRLKQVAVDDRFLYVSDYVDSKEVAIPLSDIMRVTQWRGRMLRPVTVYLRFSANVGTHVQFQPKVEEWGWAWQEDKVVQELRTLANLPTERLR